MFSKQLRGVSKDGKGKECFFFINFIKAFMIGITCNSVSQLH